MGRVIIFLEEKKGRKTLAVALTDKTKEEQGTQGLRQVVRGSS